MYPGANNTELCPTRFFTGEPLYRDGRGARRRRGRARARDADWRPYHDALAAELARLKAAHGHALLWDGHSIQSRAALAVRRPPARPEPGHRRRRELRAVAARRADARCWRRRRASATSSTAASRAATSPAGTAVRPTACTRCRWRCAGRCYLRRHRRSGRRLGRRAPPPKPRAAAHAGRGDARLAP
ncbi:MAG: N-formylglutamate amidohydrolase [Comamonadaceae bacterium]|nr:N-formylglutamate amidohydrolase [Comamonadaceae bacterium]